MRAMSTSCVPVVYKTLHWAPKFLVKDDRGQIQNKHKAEGEDRRQAPPTLV